MKRKPTTDKIQELREAIETRIKKSVQKSKGNEIKLVHVYECLIEDELMPIHLVGKTYVKNLKGEAINLSRLSIVELGEIDDMIDPPKL